MKHIKQSIILVCLLFSTLIQAQDIHFSQFYNSPLNLNPALTGVMNCNIRLSGNYRNQWASVLRSNAFKTYAVSYDQKIAVGRNDYFGFGLGLWGDKAGALSFATTQAKLSFSYSKQMGGYRQKAHYLVVGAEAGVAQRSVDFVAAQYGSQFDFDLGEYDPVRPSGQTFDKDNVVFPDFGAGVLWFSVIDKENNFYVGLAAAHLNSPRIAFKDSNDNKEQVTISPKYTLHGGAELRLTDKMAVVPGAVMMLQGPFMQINPGASAKFFFGDRRFNQQTFQVGAWYRLSNRYDSAISSDALILTSRFDLNNFGIGLSYDINVSPLNVASNGNGGFELSLLYSICGQDRRGVYCPTF